MKPKIVVICYKSYWRNRLLPTVEMFDEFFDVSWFYIDDHGWPKKISEIPDHKNQAGIIWFVGFKHLVHKFKKSFDTWRMSYY